MGSVIARVAGPMFGAYILLKWTNIERRSTARRFALIHQVVSTPIMPDQLSTQRSSTRVARASFDTPAPQLVKYRWTRSELAIASEVDHIVGELFPTHCCRVAVKFHRAGDAIGGAGPLHAARLARALGIPQVIVPSGAGAGLADNW